MATPPTLKVYKGIKVHTVYQALNVVICAVSRGFERGSLWGPARFSGSVSSGC